MKDFWFWLGFPLLWLATDAINLERERIAERRRLMESRRMRRMMRQMQGYNLNPENLGAYTLDDALDAIHHGINTRGGVRGYGPTGAWGSMHRHQAHMNVNPQYRQWYAQHRDMYSQYPRYQQRWLTGQAAYYHPEQPQTYTQYRHGHGNPYTYQMPYGWVYAQRTGRWN